MVLKTMAVVPLEPGLTDRQLALRAELHHSQLERQRQQAATKRQRVEAGLELLRQRGRAFYDPETQTFNTYYITDHINDQIRQNQLLVMAQPTRDRHLLKKHAARTAAQNLACMRPRLTIPPTPEVVSAYAPLPLRCLSAVIRAVIKLRAGVIKKRTPFVCSGGSSPRSPLTPTCGPK